MPHTNFKTQYLPLLRQAGLKATPGRLSILAVLDKSKKPLSVKDLKNKLKADDVDLATIYRTMEALAKHNMVRLVNFQHGHNHYELTDKNRHHHHLICEKCGKVVDISKCNTSKIEQEVRSLGNFAKINSHSLEFFGLCKTCARK
jgi:Fur family transcriptional regulator, ferric uptake regulator